MWEHILSITQADNRKTTADIRQQTIHSRQETNDSRQQTPFHHFSRQQIIESRQKTADSKHSTTDDRHSHQKTIHFKPEIPPTGFPDRFQDVSKNSATEFQIGEEFDIRNRPKSRATLKVGIWTNSSTDQKFLPPDLQTDLERHERIIFNHILSSFLQNLNIVLHWNEFYILLFLLRYQIGYLSQILDTIFMSSVVICMHTHTQVFDDSLLSPWHMHGCIISKCHHFFWPRSFREIYKSKQTWNSKFPRGSAFLLPLPWRIIPPSCCVRYAFLCRICVYAHVV